MFRFVLNQPVTIVISDEDGHVIARAEYANGSENSYLVRYLARDGVACERWWDEGALR
jgi:hypothetical protein